MPHLEVLPLRLKGSAATIANGLKQPEIFHRQLARFNLRRLAIGRPDVDWAKQLDEDHAMQSAEGLFLEQSRLDVVPRAAQIPTGAAEFSHWFERLRETGDGQDDPLFDWLESQASLQQMSWFLVQEAAGEAGFDDLLAYTQVKLPNRPKLEMARNYWDEMGRGKVRGMHGLMLAELIDDLGLKPQIDTTVWESLALANTMLGLALNRRYVYQSIGALGVVELTAPGRVSRVAAGLKRLGFDARQRAYFDLHSAIDLRHSREWNREVIEPLVQADPSCAAHIAQGALMRLHVVPSVLRATEKLFGRPILLP